MSGDTGAIAFRSFTDAFSKTVAMKKIQRLLILGIPVACLDMSELVNQVRGLLAARNRRSPGRFICFRDVHGVVAAQDDEELMSAHQAAFLVVADGKPLALLGRVLGIAEIQQVRGIESLPVLCKSGIEHGWRHYFLGGAPGVADELANEMQQRFPGLIVAGTECPPFRPPSEAETAATVDRINAAEADIVWVGLGSPKQDLWMARIAPRLDGCVCMGVGAAFDIHTGRVAQAPALVRKIGLEWAFRVLQEPRRLAGRYLHAIPRFVFLVASDLLRQGFRNQN